MLDAMAISSRSHGQGVPRVLIAGGGVAALETMLALRRLAGDRLEIDVLADEPAFHYRSLAVGEPFGLGTVETLPLEEFVRAHGAHFRNARLVAVDPAAKQARMGSGEVLAYDALVVASGATAERALPGALTFRGEEDAEAFTALLSDIEEGTAIRIAFVLPAGANWPVPIYELALMTAAHFDVTKRVRPEITIVTHESMPLELFGPKGSQAAEELLSKRGIRFLPERYPAELREGRLRFVPDGELVVDRVVALPRPAGPALTGLPHDEAGFIPADRHGRVRGVSDVYAAGDVTDFPIKQGGLAAEQADAVAESIAAWTGAPLKPTPFRPVLRGQLLTGNGPMYLRADLAGGRGETSQAAYRPLWWPPTKVAGKHLGPALAAAGVGPVAPEPYGLAVAVQIDLEDSPGLTGVSGG